MLQTLVLVLVFSAVVLLALAALSMGGQRRARQRLDELSGRPAAQPSRLAGVRSKLASRESSRLARWLGKLGRSQDDLDEGAPGPLRDRMIHAGYRRDGATAVYTGLRITLALTFPLVVITLPPTWGLEEWQVALALCAATGLGYLLPSIGLDRMVKRRQEQIQLALPDALDLMVVCVEAGFGINASLGRVAREFAPTHPVLSDELELVTLEIRAGKPTVDALKGLAARTGVNDISSLVSLLVQTERFGTSIADALRVHADAMRVRRMQRAEEQAGKAPLKMIFPTVVIFAATIVVLLMPALIRFDGMFEK